MTHKEAFLTDDDDELLHYPEAKIEAINDNSFTFRPISLTIMFSFLFITSSLLNTLFLIIYLRKPSLRNISNRFIVSLTVSNLVSSWILLPIVVADIFVNDMVSNAEKDLSTYLRVYTSTKALCTTFNVAADFSTSASVFSTVLIAFDRFFAITDPLHYHMLVTKCRSWLFIGLGWSLAVVVCIFSGVVGNEDGKWTMCKIHPETTNAGFYYWSQLGFGLVSFLLCFAFPLIMISWAYAKIYSAAQQNSERARRSSLCSPTLEVVEAGKAVSRSSSTRSTSSQIVSTIRRRISNASLFLYKEEARAAKISIGVIILFIFCWLPYYVTKLVYATLGPDTAPPYTFKIVVIFSVTNSTISPYMYMYRSKRIQREVWRLFGFSTKAKRTNYEKRKPIYHQLSANLERIPASPICLEGNFKLETSSHSPGVNSLVKTNQPPAKKSPSFLKIFNPSTWKRCAILSSSCVAASSLSSNSTSSTNSCYPNSYVSSNISASTQTLNNVLQVNTPLV